MTSQYGELFGHTCDLTHVTCSDVKKLKNMLIIIITINFINGSVLVFILSFLSSSYCIKNAVSLNGETLVTDVT